MEILFKPHVKALGYVTKSNSSDYLLCKGSESQPQASRYTHATLLTRTSTHLIEILARWISALLAVRLTRLVNPRPWVIGGDCTIDPWERYSHIGDIKADPRLTNDLRTSIAGELTSRAIRNLRSVFVTILAFHLGVYGPFPSS